MNFQTKLAAVMVALGLSHALGGAGPEAVAITNRTVIDPACGSSRAAMTVVLRAGRIEGIGKSARVPPGAQAIEGRGKYLNPGLVDSHIHPYPVPTAGNVKEMKELAANAPPWGITTAFSPAMPVQKFYELRPEVIIETGRYAQKMVGSDKGAGTIEPGKVADLVLLAGNPFSGIRNLAKLNRVFRAGVALSPAGQSSSESRANAKFEPKIPRAWTDSDLAEWATPVAGLNVRPGHFTEKEYYAAPVDNYRTYPLYVPGREPAGYWEMIQEVGPKPIIEPDQLKTEDDWIRAGKAVFEQLDHITMRSYDPKLIAFARSAAAFPDARSGGNGTSPVLRWVPTERGVAIGFTNCSSCHLRSLADGSVLHGPSPAGGELSGGAIVGALVSAPHHIAASPVRLLESSGMRSYRAYGVPWLEDDVHADMKTMAPADIEVLRRSALSVGNGIFARWNGSPYFPAKIPDLIGIRDYKYLDHTGTHLNRGIADLMRYIALVSVAESSDFGSHHMLNPEQRKVEHRLPDEAMYALALYLRSLRPPANANAFDEHAAAGKKIFEREGCGGCHTPPLYTNNKLTLAKGFTLPADIPKSLDIMKVSVGTDPGLALKTRKGTGYYKVPSLRGVWYRGRYLHDGSLASLEEMFDPNRLNETFAPGGWNPPATKTRAVVGHEFGLRLSAGERRSLIAFLRTL